MKTAIAVLIVGLGMLLDELRHTLGSHLSPIIGATIILGLTVLAGGFAIRGMRGMLE